MNRYALMHLWDLYHIASFCDFQLNRIFLNLGLGRLHFVSSSPVIAAAAAAAAAFGPSSALISRLCPQPWVWTSSR